MTAITVTVDDSAIRQTLAALKSRAANLQPALRDVGQELAERIRQGFSKSESPFGDKWTPLSATTQAMRKGRRQGGQPLQDTGALRGSIQSNATDSAVTIGTNKIYAGTHQHGAKTGQYGMANFKTRNGITPLPWGNIPARPFMPIRNGRAELPEDWGREVVDILRRHFSQGLAT